MGHGEVAPLTEFDGQCSHVRGSRILIYGYWDGPTSGFLQCAECGGEFLFDIIDVDEREESSDIRVFSLRALPPGSFDRAVEAMPSDQPPRWPQWWPGWEFPSKQEELNAREVVDSLQRQARPPSYVLACEIYPTRVVAGRPVSEGDWAEIQRSQAHAWSVAPGNRDWMAWLGIPREGRTSGRQ